uniref:PD-(D/E)XK nuclease family protein n=1 Tax=Bosea sp. (in: a-proteobacteria) TaxID=1871050 RepID=UPI003B3A65CD
AEPLPPLRPSGALAAADGEERPGEGPFLAEAAAAGRLSHLLLQLLPEIAAADRPAAAASLAEARGRGLPAERRKRIVADALRLLAEPALAALFGPDALAEVPIAGTITLPQGGPRAVSGRIDRFVVLADSVLVADFKTTARPPASAAELAPRTVAQLAAYAALLEAIYPGRAVRALAVYTTDLSCFELGPDQREAALAALALSQETHR